MSIAMIQAFKSTGLPPTARLVAYMLADHHNDATGRCDPSVSLLVEETGLGERTIQVALRALEKEGHLTRRQRPGSTPLYVLHPRSSCTPAAPAPPQLLHPTPAAPAPESERTVREPEENRKPVLSSTAQTDTLPGLDSSETHSDQKKKKGGPVPEAEVIAFCRTLRLPAADGTATWLKWEANGWTNNGRRIKDWQGTIRSWHAAGYLPSQRARAGGFQPPVDLQKKESAPGIRERDARRLDALRHLYPDASGCAAWEDLTLRQRAEIETYLNAPA